MKQILLFISILSMSSIGFSQQTINGSIQHDGIQRDYILYVPANYSGDDPVPLVFNFHGYTSNAGAQMGYGDFRTIADTAGFIIAHPQGTLFAGNTHWNVGGWTIGSTVDDVGFTEALIDDLANSYNIDLNRVYSTGMSNGGYMSFLLACQLSDRIAAIASVTGSMTPQTFDNCNPLHPTPVMQIHGTDDSVVPYNGEIWTKPVQEAIDYWVTYNNCDPTPTITPMADIDITDGSTVEHIVYSGGDNTSTTEHFKVTGGDHTWPGTTLNFPGTNQDINASLEIWKFFSRYDINGAITNLEDVENQPSIKIYPNPTNSVINLEHNIENAIEFEIVSLLGISVMSGTLTSPQQVIDMSGLAKEIYFLKVLDQTIKVVKN